MQPRTAFFLASALVLFLVHAHADYILQAYQHGWWTWWDLHGRAAAWSWYLDVLPRDAWHLVQSIRNHTVIFATLFAVVSVSRKSFRFSPIGTWMEKNMALRMANLLARKDPMRIFSIHATIMTTLWVLQQTVIAELLYGVTRAIAFSIPKAIWN